MIEFGLDTGESDLTWVSIKNTGERLLNNPYIKLCHTYDVNPESIQEFYTKELEVKAKYDNLFIEPHHQPFKGLWNALYMPHYRYRLWKLKGKKMGTGLIPTWRFFLAYAGVAGALFICQMVFSGISALPTVLLGFLGIVVLVLWGLWGLNLIWGLYAKARYDGLPYVANWLSYAWEIHSHRNA